MEKYQVEFVALVAANLGGTLERARTIDRMPAITGTIATAVSRLTADHFKEQLLKGLPSNVRMNLNVQHSDINLQGVLDSHLVGFVQEEVGKLLAETIKASGTYRLPARWLAKLRRIQDSVDKADARTLQIQIDELIIDLVEELKEPLFLFVPGDRRKHFEEASPFGAAVEAKFPDANRDIKAASRCFALDEWTACVFHCMRALEHPLHALAERVGVQFPTPTDLENWKNIVDKIESEVKRLESTAKSHERNEKLAFFGEAAMQVRHFKNAWRNGVSHGRDHYDERDATDVLDAAKRFMLMMAESL